ncbi:Uncharacterized protein APZ42_005805 [Daphnia magna]|uniref:Uncharacterized protein n=1 Tax=Daphnia magna TaxID=35525 RepID=A0A164G8X3_9CRUS|nr:Uncharacterized protein APZ42_005805 [Daphnia magna]
MVKFTQLISFETVEYQQYYGHGVKIHLHEFNLHILRRKFHMLFINGMNLKM